MLSYCHYVTSRTLDQFSLDAGMMCKPNKQNGGVNRHMKNLREILETNGLYTKF